MGENNKISDTYWNARCLNSSKFYKKKNSQKSRLIHFLCNFPCYFHSYDKRAPVIRQSADFYYIYLAISISQNIDRFSRYFIA